MAPSLQAARTELEKHQLEDKLEGRLERRPEREDLERRGIVGLIVGADGAGAGAGAAAEVGWGRDGSEALAGRAGPLYGTVQTVFADRTASLRQLKDQSVAPALQGKLSELERSQIEVCAVWRRDETRRAVLCLAPLERAGVGAGAGARA